VSTAGYPNGWAPEKKPEVRTDRSVFMKVPAGGEMEIA